MKTEAMYILYNSRVCLHNRVDCELPIKRHHACVAGQCILQRTIAVDTQPAKNSLQQYCPN